MSLNRFHHAFHRFGGGTFGWTEVQAQIIIVEKQLQTMPNNVRFNVEFDSTGVSALSTNMGVASTTRT